VTTLCAATGNGVALLSTGEGAWRVKAAGEGSGIQCVARDPRQPDVLIGGSRGGGVWSSSDGGETWEQVDFPQPDVFSVSVSPADGALYAGCEPSMLFVSRDGGESWEELESLRAIPSAPTWSFPPRPWTSHVRWIAPSPHDPGLLLAGIELGGVMRSEDGGETWSDHRPGAQLDCHSLAWHPTATGRAYEAAGGGAAWSSDSGATWAPADDGRDRHYTWAVAVDPEDPDRWFVSASTGPFAAHGRESAEAVVYRWEGDGPWQALDGGLPRTLDSMPYAFAFLDGQLVMGLSDGRVYASADRGDSWEQAALEGEPPRRIVAFA
jgi:BNR/Asp-box repeat protein